MAKNWYVLHVYSGFEKKVADAINETAKKQGLSESIEEVLVPMEEVVEVRRGQKVNAERKFFPGYILIKMDMNDEAWHLVKNTPKVTGFLGGGGSKPLPISEKEAEHIMHQIQEGAERPRRRGHAHGGDVDDPLQPRASGRHARDRRQPDADRRAGRAALRGHARVRRRDRRRGDARGPGRRPRPLGRVRRHVG